VIPHTDTRRFLISCFYKPISFKPARTPLPRRKFDLSQVLPNLFTLGNGVASTRRSATSRLPGWQRRGASILVIQSVEFSGSKIVAFEVADGRQLGFLDQKVIFCRQYLQEAAGGFAMFRRRLWGDRKAGTWRALLEVRLALLDSEEVRIPRLQCGRVDCAAGVDPWLYLSPHRLNGCRRAIHSIKTCLNTDSGSLDETFDGPRKRPRQQPGKWPPWAAPTPIRSSISFPKPVIAFARVTAGSRSRTPRQCAFCRHHEPWRLSARRNRRAALLVTVGTIDLDALKRHRDQLLAEAVVAFKAGEAWWPSRDFEREHIAAQQDMRHESDPWEPVIANYVEDQDRVTILEIPRLALSVPTERLGTALPNNIGASQLSRWL